MPKPAFSPMRIFQTTRYALAAGAFGLLAALSLPAVAQEYHDHDGPHGHDWHEGGPGWHGDIHHFNDEDYGRWRGGRWFHGPHDGRDGWWWMVGDQWYFYSAPIYPYPDPFVPPEVVIPAAPPPNMQYVYYCSDPAGYYPYVRECFRPWHSRLTQVIAAPPVYPAAPAAVSPPVAAYPSAPVMPPVGPAADQRKADDRQLDAFAVELDSIQPGQPHALSHVKALQAQIEAFHQALFQRGYNAMDILQDTEQLEHRVSEKRKQLSGHE